MTSLFPLRKPTYPQSFMLKKYISNSSKLHKGYFAKEESDYCSESGKNMLLQYSGAALVRDADIGNTLVGMIDQVHKTHLATDSHCGDT